MAARRLDTDEFALWIAFIRVGQLLPDRLDAELRADGTTHARFEILSVLARFPQGLRFTDVGRYALVSKPRLSVHVAELCRDGLTERRPDPADGRSSLLTITRAGTRALESWRTKHLALVRSLVLDHVPASQRASLTAILHRTLRALGDTWDPGDVGVGPSDRREGPANRSGQSATSNAEAKALSGR